MPLSWNRSNRNTRANAHTTWAAAFQVRNRHKLGPPYPPAAQGTDARPEAPRGRLRLPVSRWHGHRPEGAAGEEAATASGRPAGPLACVLWQTAHLPGPPSVLLLEGSPVSEKNATPVTPWLRRQQETLGSASRTHSGSAIGSTGAHTLTRERGPGGPRARPAACSAPSPQHCRKHRPTIWKLGMNGIPPYLETHD